ncbi:hypothetical protein LY90DRAFT_701317, partial [Neocallimastix californiae]
MSEINEHNKETENDGHHNSSNKSSRSSGENKDVNENSNNTEIETLHNNNNNNNNSKKEKEKEKENNKDNTSNKNDNYNHNVNSDNKKENSKESGSLQSNGNKNNEDNANTNSNANTDNWRNGDSDINTFKTNGNNDNNYNNKNPDLLSSSTINQNNINHEIIGSGGSGGRSSSNEGKGVTALPIISIIALVLMVLAAGSYFIIKKRKKSRNKLFPLPSNVDDGKTNDNISIIYGTGHVEKKLNNEELSNQDNQDNQDNAFSTTNITEMNYNPTVIGLSTFHDYATSCADSNYSVVGLPYQYRSSFISTELPNQPQQFSLPYSTPANETTQIDLPSHAPVIDLDISASSLPKADTALN